MAQAKAVKVDIADVFGEPNNPHGHDYQLQEALEWHLNEGWTLLNVIYCHATAAWASHFMLFFSKEK